MSDVSWSRWREYTRDAGGDPVELLRRIKLGLSRSDALNDVQCLYTASLRFPESESSDETFRQRLEQTLGPAGAMVVTAPGLNLSFQFSCSYIPTSAENPPTQKISLPSFHTDDFLPQELFLPSSLQSGNDAEEIQENTDKYMHSNMNETRMKVDLVDLIRKSMVERKRLESMEISLLEDIYQTTSELSVSDWVDILSGVGGIGLLTPEDIVIIIDWDKSSENVFTRYLFEHGLAEWIQTSQGTKLLEGEADFLCDSIPGSFFDVICQRNPIFLQNTPDFRKSLKGYGFGRKLGRVGILVEREFTERYFRVVAKRS